MRPRVRQSTGEVREAAPRRRGPGWPEVGSRAPTPKEAVVKLRLPSPAMVVAIIALVVALSGTAIAAVDFAQQRRRGRRQERRRRQGLAALGGRQARGDLDGRQRQGPDPRALPGRRHARRDADAVEVPAHGRQPGRARRRRCSSSRASGASTRSATTSTRRWARRRRAPRSTSRPRSIRASTSRACSGATSAPASAPPSSARPRASRCRSWPAPTGSSRSSWRPRAARSSSPAPRARTTAPGPKAACLLWGTAFRVG